MKPVIVLLTIPGLRRSDLPALPSLQALADGGGTFDLRHHFPAVTWTSQSNMLTGHLPNQHGVIANGFYWREKNEVEMWTAWNDKIQRPQLWDSLKQKDRDIETMAWFPMLSKGCGADFVCMPAPIHRPDGSEDLWCYTKPQDFYGELLKNFGHFPLQHFWGPLANIKSTQWIVDSANAAFKKFRPDFSYIYLPHLDYAAQKFGPDSDEADNAVVELNQAVDMLIKFVTGIYDDRPVCWIAASEYVITPVNDVVYPNRILRDAGFLTTMLDDEQRELIDFENTPAWALVDHQFSHVFVSDENKLGPITKLFESTAGIEQIFAGARRGEIGMEHDRAGEIILVSSRNSWQAYYWWQNDSRAPRFAKTVDIHRKPGYDPVELFFDLETKSVPLDAGLIRGSHGAVTVEDDLGGVLVTNATDFADKKILHDIDLYGLILDRF